MKRKESSAPRSGARPGLNHDLRHPTNYDRASPDDRRRSRRPDRPGTARRPSPHDELTCLIEHGPKVSPCTPRARVVAVRHRGDGWAFGAARRARGTSDRLAANLSASRRPRTERRTGDDADHEVGVQRVGDAGWRVSDGRRTAEIRVVDRLTGHVPCASRADERAHVALRASCGPYMPRLRREAVGPMQSQFVVRGRPWFRPDRAPDLGAGDPSHPKRAPEDGLRGAWPASSAARVDGRVEAPEAVTKGEDCLSRTGAPETGPATLAAFPSGARSGRARSVGRAPSRLVVDPVGPCQVRRAPRGERRRVAARLMFLRQGSWPAGSARHAIARARSSLVLR